MCAYQLFPGDKKLAKNLFELLISSIYQVVLVCRNCLAVQVELFSLDRFNFIDL